MEFNQYEGIIAAFAERLAEYLIVTFWGRLFIRVCWGGCPSLGRSCRRRG
jgi:hypothetical protein